MIAGSDGWIKLHRALLSWEWFTTPNMVHFWIYCLLSASHEPKKYRGIDLDAGQFVSGRKLLSANTGLSEREVRTCIERLKSTNEMTSQSYHDFSVFTIISWEKYQVTKSSDQPNDQQATSQRPANDQPTTTIKKERIKEHKKEKKIIQNTLFIPPTLEEVKQYCNEQKYKFFDCSLYLNLRNSNNWEKSNGKKVLNWKNDINTSQSFGNYQRQMTEDERFDIALAETAERLSKEVY